MISTLLNVVEPLNMLNQLSTLSKRVPKLTRNYTKLSVSLGAWEANVVLNDSDNQLIERIKDRSSREWKQPLSKPNRQTTERSTIGSARQINAIWLQQRAHSANPVIVQNQGPKVAQQPFGTRQLVSPMWHAQISTRPSLWQNLFNMVQEIPIVEGIIN